MDELQIIETLQSDRDERVEEMQRIINGQIDTIKGLTDSAASATLQQSMLEQRIKQLEDEVRNIVQWASEWQ